MIKVDTTNSFFGFIYIVFTSFLPYLLCLVVPTVVAYEVPTSSPSATWFPNCFPGWNCISTCRGHGCRVWDAILAPVSEPHGSIPWKEGWCIVSASEDSVVRIYSLQGSVLRELQGAKLMWGRYSIV